MQSSGVTANDRFKARARRLKWLAIALTVGVHVAIFMFTPAFEVHGVGTRMMVAIGDWGPPGEAASVHPRHAAFDSARRPPAPVNLADVNSRLPRLYPWHMWHHREPASALVELSVSRSGRVLRATLLETTDNGGDAALLGLARLLRFEPPELPDGASTLVATARVRVVDPALDARHRGPGFILEP